MQKILLLLIIGIFTTIITNAQSSIYPNVDTFHVQSNELAKNHKEFSIRNPKDKDRDYRRSVQYDENIDRSKPFYLKVYTRDHVLVSEYYCISDCCIGSFIDYYYNGSIKRKGHCRVNTTGDWTNLWDRKLCSVADGTWIHYDVYGNPTYAEFWEDGEFIQQRPEQKVNELWKADFMIDTFILNDKDTILATEFNDLFVQPSFKNTATQGTQLRMDVSISSNNRQIFSRKVSDLNIQNIDLQAIIQNNNFIQDDMISISLMIYDENDKYVWYLNLKVQV